METLLNFLPSPCHNTTPINTNYQLAVIEGFLCARSCAQHSTYRVLLILPASIHQEDVLPAIERGTERCITKMWPRSSKAPSLKPSTHFLVTGFKLLYFPCFPFSPPQPATTENFCVSKRQNCQSLDFKVGTGKFSPDFNTGELHFNNIVPELLHG